MKLLPDTNTLNYLLKGQPSVVNRMDEMVQRGADFLLSSVVHYELTRYLDLKGAHSRKRAYDRLTSSWKRCYLGFDDWSAAAQLWAERHRIGRAISDLDLFLTILARREDAVIVTSNTRHFEDLGVALEDWTLPSS